MRKPTTITVPKRGDIFLVNFDPAVGSEIQKTRPAVIIQNNIANRHSPITIVAAITSQFSGRLYPTEVKVEPKESGLKNESVALLNQIRSIDKQRLIRRIGRIYPQTMRRIDQALRISCGLIEI